MRSSRSTAVDSGATRLTKAQRGEARAGETEAETDVSTGAEDQPREAEPPTNTSALAGNDVATFPDYPSEIRAPQGTLAGVSGFVWLYLASKPVAAMD